MCWVKLGLNILKDPFQFLNSMRIKLSNGPIIEVQEVSIPSRWPEEVMGTGIPELFLEEELRCPSPQLYPPLVIYNTRVLCSCTFL